MPSLMSIPAWTPAHDEAFVVLLAAWRHHDDVRNDAAATLRERSHALLALARARQGMHAADILAGQAILAA